MASEPEVITRLRDESGGSDRYPLDLNCGGARAILAAWDELQRENAELLESIEALIQQIPADCRIRSHEGLGPENPIGSLTLSFFKLRDKLGRENATLRERLEAAERERDRLETIIQQTLEAVKEDAGSLDIAPIARGMDILSGYPIGGDAMYEPPQ